jgi:hypothetical protein
VQACSTQLPLAILCGDIEALYSSGYSELVFFVGSGVCGVPDVWRTCSGGGGSMAGIPGSTYMPGMMPGMNPHMMGMGGGMPGMVPGMMPGMMLGMNGMMPGVLSSFLLMSNLRLSATTFVRDSHGDVP